MLTATNATSRSVGPLRWNPSSGAAVPSPTRAVSPNCSVRLPPDQAEGAEEAHRIGIGRPQRPLWIDELGSGSQSARLGCAGS